MHAIARRGLRAGTQAPSQENLHPAPQDLQRHACVYCDGELGFLRGVAGGPSGMGAASESGRVTMTPPPDPHFGHFGGLADTRLMWPQRMQSKYSGIAPSLSRGGRYVESRPL
jgi:hypothetical protein